MFGQRQTDPGILWRMLTESFVSLTEACKLYRVSRRTMERLIKRGEVPYHRIGRQIRLLPSDLIRVTGQFKTAEVLGRPTGGTW